jgi:hypothetical protein
MVLHSSAKTTNVQQTVHSDHPECFHTRKALIESGQLTAL